MDALIHHDADLKLRDNLGRTAVHMCCMCGHMALLSSLLSVSPVMDILNLHFKGKSLTCVLSWGNHQHLCPHWKPPTFVLLWETQIFAQ